MREILFRGKCKYINEWIEGDLLHLDDNPFAILEREADYFDSFNEVFPETVGQYTGLKDKNGKKIFEGDLIKYNINDNSYDIGVIEWCYDTWKFVYPILDSSTSIWESRMEVIGNIHDNPDLT